MACECGCGFEGEDEVTQYLIEESLLIRLEAEQASAIEEMSEQPEPEPPKPGEITDPAMQHAMAQAKRLHLERFGRRV